MYYKYIVGKPMPVAVKKATPGEGVTS